MNGYAGLVGLFVAEAGVLDSDLVKTYYSGRAVFVARMLSACVAARSASAIVLMV